MALVALRAPRAQSLLTMSSILRLGKSDFPTVPIDADSFERIATCMRVLLEPNPATAAVFLNECHANYATLLASQTVRRHVGTQRPGVRVADANPLGWDGHRRCAPLAAAAAPLQAAPKEAKEEVQRKSRHPDALIQFRQLKSKRSALDELDDQYELDLTRATGLDETQADTMSKLSRIVQLTGAAASAPECWLTKSHGC